MPRRFVVIEDVLPSAVIDGHGLFNQTRAYVERLAHEYRARERLQEAILAAETHVPRESYVLLAAALSVFLLQRALVTLSAWRAVRRHAKAE